MFVISFFIVKKRNKVSQNHIFFPILRNKTKFRSYFVFPCGKYEWPFGYNFRNSLFRCEETSGRFGAVYKILYFVV